MVDVWFKTSRSASRFHDGVYDCGTLLTYLRRASAPNYPMGQTDYLTMAQRRQRIARILLRAAFLLARKEGWIPKREASQSSCLKQEGMSHINPS